MVGEKILGYTVDEKIGSGGFGTVYKVSKTNPSGTYVRALKHITIPSQKQYADVLNSMGGDYSKADDYFASVLQEIVNEIQIISSLSEAGTQNIVRYYENDIVETQSPKRYDIYILMELLTPFTDYMYQNELKVRDVIKIGKDILTALESCHSQNVIHRDIKDDNIFVSSDGAYKLGDFGVSKVVKDKSKAESMKGTPNFIAPEVYLGKEKYDATVDLYSLGIVLYKLLNKSRNPFLPAFPAAYNSDDEDLAFEKRMKGDTPELPYDAKNSLGEAIIKAIRGRAERYNSASEFKKALMEAESQLTAEELDVTVNQVINMGNVPVQPKKNEEMNETIGTDVTAPIQQAKKNDNEDRNLFETVSDTYNKTPIKAGSSVKIAETARKETSKKETETEPRVQRTYTSSFVEQPQVEAVTKSDMRWVAFVIPVVIVAIYVIVYLILLPNLYGKTLSIANWAITNPEEVIEKLQDQNAVFLPIYKIWAFRIFLWLLWAGFIGSLFNLGRVLQNKKPEYNINGLMRDKEPYYKAMEIYDSVKILNDAKTKDARVAIRNVMERLRNESTFGMGNVSVINCENDIARCLQEIEESVPALNNEKSVSDASDVIVADCKTIMTKLRIRTEMKKK